MHVGTRRLTEEDIAAVVAFSLAAWAPVFAGIRDAMGADVFALVHRDWRADQAAAVEEVCRSPATDAWVAVAGDRPIGFVATQLGQEGDARIGEIVMIAVDPAHQRTGVAAALMRLAEAELRAAGVPLVVLGTGGDPGHAPARALYERLGFHGYPMLRYYRRL